MASKKGMSKGSSSTDHSTAKKRMRGRGMRGRRGQGMMGRRMMMGKDNRFIYGNRIQRFRPMYTTYEIVGRGPRRHMGSRMLPIARRGMRGRKPMMTMSNSRGRRKMGMRTMQMRIARGPMLVRPDYLNLYYKKGFFWGPPRQRKSMYYMRRRRRMMRKRMMMRGFRQFNGGQRQDNNNVPVPVPAPGPPPNVATPLPATPTSGVNLEGVNGVTPKPTLGMEEIFVTPMPSVDPGTKPQGTPQPTSTEQAPDPTQCGENPRDYRVNIDLQIAFPNNEFVACDSDAQDSAINTNIQAALNENFATTVSDWDGDAFFGTFVFDPDQEVNNVARRLQQGTCSPRNVDCAADFCRWGCLTAATTDCGTSSITNWVLLENDIQQRLAGLGFACLGVPEELNVILVVQDP